MMTYNLGDFYKQYLLDKIGGENAFKLLVKGIGVPVPAQYYLIKSDGNILKGTYIVKDGEVISIK